MKILLVCLGNICRSPLAEGILKDKLQKKGLSFTIDSAGTNGYHTGEPPHHLSQKVAKKNGIDIGKQISRRFTKNDIDNYDIIYAMAADVMQDIKKIAGDKFDNKKIMLFLNELHPGQNKDVPDPWYGDEDGYDEVYALLNEACEAIAEKLQ